jgi:hypothetical protein
MTQDIQSLSWRYNWVRLQLKNTKTATTLKTNFETIDADRFLQLAIRFRLKGRREFKGPKQRWKYQDLGPQNQAVMAYSYKLRVGNDKVCNFSLLLDICNIPSVNWISLKYS